jgi:hypothetical protein
VIKKTLATVAVAASVVGATGIAATPALAVGGDHEQNSVSGNGNKQVYGNTTTGGYMSPNISLINGSFNRFCLNAEDIDPAIAALIGVSVTDLLNSKPHNTCSDNSTVIDGDDPLSHILSDLSVLSENGVSKH